MRWGFQHRCRMAARGDSQSRGRWRTTLREQRSICPACACSSSSVLTKFVSFVVEEWAPYLIALVDSWVVMPLSVLIGTPCTRMCSRSVAEGYWLRGSWLSSCGTLASTHAWKKSTVLALTASLFAELSNYGRM